MEEINCLDCIHIADNFDCEKYCGSKKGWGGYQTEKYEVI